MTEFKSVNASTVIPPRVPIDFGDLLIAVAEDLDHIRQCVGCGQDSTWAGLWVADDGLVNVSAWCDAASCEHDRTVLSAGQVLAVPINHLPKLRTIADDGPTLATVEQMLKQLEHDRGVPYWQGEPHGPSLDAAAVWLESLRDHLSSVRTVTR